jgi:hypothetical protein
LEVALIDVTDPDGFAAPAWRAAIGPYFAAPPQVEHFTDVD